MKGGASATVPPFQHVLDRHRTEVYRFLVAAAGPSEADDCFQETFLAALRAYPRLRDGENLRAWLLTIASRKVIDAARARRRRPRPTEDAIVLADEPGTDAGIVDPDDPLWRAVRALPARQRTAVVLRHVLDRPYEEVAQVMGSPVETARSHVAHGTRSLRAALGSKEPDEKEER